MFFLSFVAIELKPCELATKKGPIIITSVRMPAKSNSYRNAYRGEAVAKYEVSQTDTVDSLEIKHSSNKGLSQAITRAVSNWRFEPAIQENKATPVVCTPLLRFTV